MKVRSLGFRLKPVGKCTIADLADRLIAHPEEEFLFHGLDHRFYCTSITSSSAEKYAVGLLLTIRDQKKFLQLQETGGNLKVTVTELDDDSRSFDFNFFVVHLESGSGLYSHYHHSSSLKVFHAFLRDQYLRALKSTQAEKEIDNNVRVRKSKTQDLELQAFYRRDTFEDVVKQLQEVNQFEYDILVPASMTNELQPISSQLKLERRQIRFKAGVSGRSILQRIRGLIPSSSASQQRFRIVGKDSQGDKTLIDYVAPADHYSEDEFDDLADDKILNLREVSNSSYIQTLLATFEKRKSVFTATSEDEE